MLLPNQVDKKDRRSNGTFLCGKKKEETILISCRRNEFACTLCTRYSISLCPRSPCSDSINGVCCFKRIANNTIHFDFSNVYFHFSILGDRLPFCLVASERNANKSRFQGLGGGGNHFDEPLQKSHPPKSASTDDLAYLICSSVVFSISSKCLSSGGNGFSKYESMEGLSVGTTVGVGVKVELRL